MLCFSLFNTAAHEYDAFTKHIVTIQLGRYYSSLHYSDESIFRCGMLDIPVEMDRFLWPGGAAIIWDTTNVLRVKETTDRLQLRSQAIALLC